MELANPKSGAAVPGSAPSIVNGEEFPAWAVGRFTPEELQRMTQDDSLEGALELKDFLPELEAIAREKRHGE